MPNSEERSSTRTASQLNNCSSFLCTSLYKHNSMKRGRAVKPLNESHSRYGDPSQNQAIGSYKAGVCFGSCVAVFLENHH